MKKRVTEDVNDICVALAFALGAWERGEPGAEARHQALRERLKRMAKRNATEGVQQGRPQLRLVHSVGDRPETGQIEKASLNCPRLTLVRAIDHPTKHRDSANGQPRDIQ